MARLSLHGIQKHYASLQVVHDIDMEISDGEFIVIVDPSGCDRSTLLRMMTDLGPTTGGEVWIGDCVVDEFESVEYDITMVSQNYALYPYMSMFDNIAYDLKVRGLPKNDTQACMEQVAGILELDKLLDRKPRQLPSGQRQRVVIGQAIVREPATFLLDEPLSNLDAKLRMQMCLELKDLHRHLRMVSLYVTYDQVEAMVLAGHMVVLSGGRVEQIGTPFEVCSRPTSIFVANFIDSPPMNPVSVSHNAGGNTQTRVDGVKESDIATTLGHLPMGLHLPEHALMGLRLRRIEPCSVNEAIAFIDVRVVEVLGTNAFVYDALVGYPVVTRLKPYTGIKAGDKLPIIASAEHLHWFGPQATCRIEALA